MRCYVRRIVTAACALVGFAPAVALAQQGTTITGRVTDAGGAPVPAAQVVIDGTTMGAQAGDDGRYSIVVPASRANGQQVKLTARRVGYRPQEATITLAAGTITHDFVLEAAAAGLAEVVVNALNMTQEKTTVGTSQQTVSGSDITRTKDPNVVSALSGKVSGVTITNPGTQGGSSRIVIRGPSSILGNNQPLFVVDGIPVSNSNVTTNAQANAAGGIDYGSAISDINPDDIASISVLKGPTAAALYGSRATNGAIVITTKSGKTAARGVSVTASTYTTFDKPLRLPEFQNLYGQGAGGEFNFVDGAGGGTQDDNDQSFGPRLDGRTMGCVFAIDSVTKKKIIGTYDQTIPCNQFTGAGPWIPHPDNVKDFFNTGRSMTNHIALSANGENVNARLGITDEQVNGMVPNNFLRKQAASLSGAAQLNDRATANASIQFVKNGGVNRAGTGYNVGILEQFIWFGRQVDTRPLRNYYDADGNLYNWNYNFHNNPFWLQYENPQRDDRNRVIGMASVNYQFTPWLSALVRTGIDTYDDARRQGFAQGNINFANPNYAGGFNFYNRHESEFNSDAIVTAVGSLGDHFDVDANVGASMRRNNMRSNQQTTDGLSVPGIYNVSNAAITPTLFNTVNDKGINSVLGQVSVTYNKFWTVQVTGRNDWSSTLPKGNNSYFYPSVNTSFVLTEAFPSLRSGALSFAKIRGGYSQTGNDTDPYQLATTYTGQATKFGSSPQFTLADRIANTNLKPERTTAAEVGLELSFFNDRINFDATYYSQSTKDQLIPVTVAPASGFTSKMVNAGEMTNKGIEAAISATPVKLDNSFEWRTSFNFSKNTNKVVSLVPEQNLKTIIVGGTWSVNVEAREGESYGALVGAPFLRDAATGKLITSGGRPLADNANRRVLGNYNPDWVGGWNNEFKYKNASLGFLLDIRRGGDIFSVTNMFGTYAGVLASTIPGRDVDWDNPGILVDGIDQKTGLPNETRITAERYYQSLYGIHEAFVQDASFIKLREVRFGYDLPSRWISGLGIKSANVALVGRNLWLDTKIPNIDPEIALSTGNVQGLEFASLPSARSFGFNITVTP